MGVRNRGSSGVDIELNMKIACEALTESHQFTPPKRSPWRGTDDPWPATGRINFPHQAGRYRWEESEHSHFQFAKKSTHPSLRTVVKQS